MYYYKIAGLYLYSERDLVSLGLYSFKPFAVECCTITPDCQLKFVPQLDISSYDIAQELSQSYIADANADSNLYRTEHGYLYTIKQRIEGAKVTIFHIDSHTCNITTNISIANDIDLSLLRFGIWIMFGIVMTNHNAIAIHSSTIVSKGRAVLFLGESGTGKSTHTRLWREHIEGATLLNDDSPIIRIEQNEVKAYGSPWSGKTPCYKNESYPIGGICRLVQAPKNQINRLSTIMSIGAILPSCPPMFAHDDILQDRICETVGNIVRQTPIYVLECLPDSNAAKLSHSTIIGDE